MLEGGENSPHLTILNVGRECGNFKGITSGRPLGKRDKHDPRHGMVNGVEGQVVEETEPLCLRKIDEKGAQDRRLANRKRYTVRMEA